MTSSKSTKRALLTSVLALLMCVTMLVGATFAWFTDTASTGVNKIQAGNLKMEVTYKNTADGRFEKVSKETPVFNNNALWEPGHVEYVVLRVSNAGSLALKYKLGINIAGERGSTNVLDNEFKLSDYIKFGVINGESNNLSDRDKLVAEAEESGSVAALNAGYTKEDDLLKGEDKVVTLVVWMPTTVGNEANHKTEVTAPSIDLGISVAATQLNSEVDSFGPDYDKFADYPEVQPVATLEQLQEVLTSDDINGKTIKLYDNLDNVTNLRISDKDIALDLNGKSMKTENLQVNGSKIVIKDTSEGRNGKIETTDSYAVVQAENSDVTIESGKFISSYNKDGGSGYAPVIQVRNSELTINGGYFENTNDVGSYNYLIKAPSYSKTERTTITINGGTFVSNRDYGYIVTGDSNANVDVVINGGEFTTTGRNSYLTNVKGSVVVNNCTFTATGNNTVFNIPNDSTVTVKGGTFSVNKNSYTDPELAGLIFHRKTNGWTSVYGTLLVDPVNPVKVNQPTYVGFLAEGATQSAQGADGFYTISK